MADAAIGDAVAIRALLVRMAFSNDAAVCLTNTEHINTITKIKDLNEKRITKICSVARRPGGGDDGVAIAAEAETNFLVASHVVKNWERTGREGDFNHTDVVLDPPTLWRKTMAQMDLEANWDNNKLIVTPLTDKQVEGEALLRTVDKVQESFFLLRGVDGVPIGYLTRKLIVPKASADDLSTSYATMDREMVMRARIVLPQFEGDDDLEEAGANKRTRSANVDDLVLFQILMRLFEGT